MPVLGRIEKLRLRPPARAAYANVSLKVADHDAMYAGNAAHYLECGASALTVIHTAAVLAGIRPATILDFGAGAGRVTRWLRAHWPQAQLAATDLRAQDLEFCAAEFGCATWVSGQAVDTLEAPARYDVIWAGSVLTHLNERQALALLGKLLSWTRPDGIVIASLHGRFVTGRGPAHDYYGLARGRWAALQHAYLGGDAYGFADYPATPGYGISIARPAWAATLPERLADTRLVLFGERLWDDHHDVVALQRRAIEAGA